RQGRIGDGAPSVMFGRSAQRTCRKARRKGSRRAGEFAELLPAGCLRKTLRPEGQYHLVGPWFFEGPARIDQRDPDKVGMIDVSLTQLVAKVCFVWCATQIGQREDDSQRVHHPVPRLGSPAEPDNSRRAIINRLAVKQRLELGADIAGVEKAIQPKRINPDIVKRVARSACTYRGTVCD